MEKIFVFLLLLVSVCGSSAEVSSASETDELHFRSELDAQWKDYVKTYNKSYSDKVEMIRRRHVWEENVDTIQKHNEEAAMGVHTYTMGVNQFTDMTYSEFSDKYLSGYDLSDTASDVKTELDPDLEAPPSFDWRAKDKNAVTEVKNQGPVCESCWAFSATGAIEGQWKIHKGQLESLSEQQLVDCSRSFGNNGCNRGRPEWAFNYVIQNGGIDKESCYIYEAKDATCRYKKSCVAASVRSYTSLRAGEANLMTAVATVGPISAAISVPPSMQHYKGGIFSDPNCNSLPVEHAVLVVGYEPTYWIIKNSYGKGWGDNGYLHLAKNKGDMCHVSLEPSYPTV